MMDALFLDAESLGTLVTTIAEFVGFGLGLAFVFWVLGYVVWFIIDACRVI